MNEFFKGIALFTPGGDLVYCIDSTKRERWHLNLCIKLQELLNLPEPPHFLVPFYTATIDRGLNAQTQELQTWAEVYPAVKRHRTLLEAIFGVYDLKWHQVPWQQENSHPLLIESYRQNFPQLWESHDLIVPYNWNPIPEAILVDFNYVLTLFVCGNSTKTKETLKIIHQLLEENFPTNYKLKVVDISKQPEEAERHHIWATPTLIRVWPQPRCRVVGALEDTQKVLKIITA